MRTLDNSFSNGWKVTGERHSYLSASSHGGLRHGAASIAHRLATARGGLFIASLLILLLTCLRTSASAQGSARFVRELERVV